MNKKFSNILCGFIPNKVKRDKLRRAMRAHTTWIGWKEIWEILTEKKPKVENKVFDQELLSTEDKTSKYFNELINTLQKGINAQVESSVQTLQKNIQAKLDAMNRKLDGLNSITRLAHPLTSFPAPEGYAAIMGPAMGKMLELIDIICHEHKIPYFLYAGALIGARVNGKRQPWDDDWDVGMLRADWERFRELCDKLFKNSKDFSPNFLGFTIQFRYRQTGLYGDVFPFDQYCKDCVTQADWAACNAKVMKARGSFSQELFHINEKRNVRNMDIPNIKDYHKIQEIFHKIVNEGLKPAPDGALLENSLLTSGPPDGKEFRYSWIFPLQRIQFEGVEVDAPADIDAVLGKKYGDIYDLPEQLNAHNQKVQFHHLADYNDLIHMDMRQAYETLLKESGMK